MGDLRQKIGFVLTLVGILQEPVFGVFCGGIIFPSLNEYTLSAPEHSLVKIPFKFPEKTCVLENDVILTIARKTPGSRIPTVYCRILQLNGSCEIPRREYGCSCSQHTGEFLFTKTVTREDGTLWIWRTDANKRETAITFNVT
ncbi:hypothetical protein BaRGS_00024943, partial [Batillaria attramentaria]